MEPRGFVDTFGNMAQDAIGGGSGDRDKTVTEITTTTIETTDTATTTVETTDTATTTVETTAPASTSVVTSVVTSQTTVTAEPSPTEPEVRTVTATPDSEPEETSAEEEVTVTRKASKTHPKSSHGSEATTTSGADSGDQPAEEQATSTSDSGSDKAKPRRELRFGRDYHDSALEESTAAVSQSQLLGRAPKKGFWDWPGEAFSYAIHHRSASAPSESDLLEYHRSVMSGAVGNGALGTTYDIQPTTVTLSASATTTDFNGTAAGQTAPSSDASGHDTSSAYSEATSRRGRRNRRDHHNLPRFVTSTLAAFTAVTIVSTLHSPGARAIAVPHQLTSTALLELPVPSSTLKPRENPSATPSSILVVAETSEVYYGPSDGSKVHAVRDCGIACFDEGQTITTSVSVSSTPLVARDDIDAHSSTITASDKHDTTATPYGTLHVPNSISQGFPVRRHAGEHAPFGLANFGNSSNSTFLTRFVGTTGIADSGSSGASIFTSLTTSNNGSTIKHSDSLRRRWQGNRRRVARYEAELDVRAELDMRSAAATTTVAANGEDEAPLRRGVESSFVPTSTLDDSGPFLALAKRAAKPPKPKPGAKKSTQTTDDKLAATPITTSSSSSSTSSSSSSSSSSTTSSSSSSSASTSTTLATAHHMPMPSGSGAPTTETPTSSHHTKATSSHAASHTSVSESKKVGLKDKFGALTSAAGAVSSAVSSGGKPSFNASLLPDFNDTKLWEEDINGILSTGGEAPHRLSGQQSASKGADGSPATPTNSHDPADGQGGTATISHSTSSEHEQGTGHSPTDSGLQRRDKSSTRPSPKGAAATLPTASTTSSQRSSSSTKTSSSSTSKTSSAAPSGASGQGTRGAQKTNTSTTRTPGHTAASSAPSGQGNTTKSGGANKPHDENKACPAPIMKIRVID